MFDTLVQIDKELFLFFNGLHNSFFDQIMWWFSAKWFWIPLYLAVLAYWIKKYKLNVIWLVVFAALVVLTSDQISVAIKFAVERPRPSHNPEFMGLIHHINNYKGGSFGFVSSHAANTFGFAIFSLMFIRKRWYAIGILVWAAVVSYSRVYLGVHYPADIAFGGLLGLFLGYLLYFGCNYGMQRWPIKK